jgi:hypothetical protein
MGESVFLDKYWKFSTIKCWSYYVTCFGNGSDSSWDSCKFDEFLLGGEVHIFDKEIKNFERILICLSPADFCISLPFICEMSVC